MDNYPALMSATAIANNDFSPSELSSRDELLDRGGASDGRNYDLAASVDHRGGLDYSRGEPPSTHDHMPGYDRGGGTHVGDHGRLYNVQFQSASDVTFGDRIIQQIRDAEEAAVARGYRTIPMGDIALHGEVLQQRHCKFYAARVKGLPATVTVYRGGDDAKKICLSSSARTAFLTPTQQWEQEVMESARGLCHPNLLQLFAVAAINQRYAVVYHGDLIPVEELASRRSVLSRADLWLRAAVEMEAVMDEVDHILDAENSTSYFLFLDPTYQRFCIQPFERHPFNVTQQMRHLRDFAKQFTLSADRKRRESLVQHLSLRDIYDSLQLGQWEADWVKWGKLPGGVS
ncbi:hypothetical protein MKEN_00162900 [Mycena kentingensis (nom. inval.)]|nr:hypothetical protein MKEN_00162900 [Mycena kentingensis (nom. inval.)]